MSKAAAAAPVVIESQSDSVVVVRLFDVLLVSLTPPEGDEPNLVIYPMGDAESLFSMRFDIPWPWHAVGTLTGEEIGFRVTFPPAEEEVLDVKVTHEGIIIDHYQGDELADTAIIGHDQTEAALELPPGLFGEFFEALARGDNAPYRCDDCGRVEPRLRTKPARDLLERLDPDGEPTDRECSACGALTYPYGRTTT